MSEVVPTGLFAMMSYMLGARSIVFGTNVDLYRIVVLIVVAGFCVLDCPGPRSRPETG